MKDKGYFGIRCLKKIMKLKLRITNVMVRFFSNLFTSECPECKIGRVRYIGDDRTGHTWISVYKCKNCKSEFI
jgi:transposase-like protein